MIKLFEQLLDLIYRKKCYFCGHSKYSLKMCDKCYDKLEFCEYSINRVINGVNVYCAGVYTKELQKLIRGLKYHNQRELAYYQAKFMFEYFSHFTDMREKQFLLIPVPMHKNRIKQRKYNHTNLICEEFAKLSGFQCEFELIERVKDTKPQYKLSKNERLINLSDAFTINKNKIITSPLMIIDDICTTGATFEEIIKVLKKEGYNDIVCFATSTPNYN